MPHLYRLLFLNASRSLKPLSRVGARRIALQIDRPPESLCIIHLTFIVICVVDLSLFVVLLFLLVLYYLHAWYCLMVVCCIVLEFCVCYSSAGYTNGLYHHVLVESFCSSLLGLCLLASGGVGALFRYGVLESCMVFLNKLML